MKQIFRLKKDRRQEKEIWEEDRKKTGWIIQRESEIKELREREIWNRLFISLYFFF